MGKGKGKPGLGRAVKKGAAKDYLEAVCLDPNPFEDEPKPKIKKIEVERLKRSSDWEDWADGEKLR